MTRKPPANRPCSAATRAASASASAVHLGITRLDGAQRRNVTSRHDQYVHRRLRSQIPKRDAVRALSHKFRPELTPGNTTKDAVGGRVAHSYPIIPTVGPGSRGTLCSPHQLAARTTIA